MGVSLWKTISILCSVDKCGESYLLPVGNPVSVCTPHWPHFIYISRVQPHFSIPWSPPNPHHNHLLPGPLWWSPQPLLAPAVHSLQSSLACVRIWSLSKRKWKTSWRTHLQNIYLINDLCPEYIKNFNNSKRGRRRRKGERCRGKLKSNLKNDPKTYM